jgi:DNA-binding response OmpR family regulator
MRILLVEDEKYMARATREVLTRHHYAVDLAYNGTEGLECALSGIYDLVVLDIMLPKMDGISVLKEIRAHGLGVPVILLTARDAVGDRVNGLDAGADDYLPKPFHMDELLARIRALGRRNAEAVPSDEIAACGLALNPRTLIISKGERHTELTPRESRLAETFMANAGNVLTKEHIILKIWGYDSDAEDNHAEVLVSALRKKLDLIGAKGTIRTVRGMGYVFGEK